MIFSLAASVSISHSPKNLEQACKINGVVRNKAATFAILNLIATACGFALVCYFIHDLDLTSFVKGRIFAVCLISYLVASISIYLGVKDQEQRVLSERELALSKLMSVLDTQSSSQSEKVQLSLIEVADQLVEQVENLRQGQRAIVDFSKELICALDSNLRIIDINTNAERMWLYPNSSVIGASIMDLLVASDRERSLAYFSTLKKETLAPLINRVIDINGKMLDFSWSVEWSASRSTYYCVATDITAEKEIERLRAEITSMVSHDLRAPISSLSYFVDGLIEGEFGSLNETGRKQILKLRENLQQVLRLINQLLDAENLESGTMVAEVKVVPASAILESSINLLQSLSEQKSISIQSAESDELVFADFDRIIQVLNNLLSNAIKFSPAGSMIQINVSEDAGFVKFEVIDQGVGIAAENCELIFDRFKTLYHQSSSSHGLGLYISKKLVELQGGSIGVQSTIGAGSTFWFALKQATEADLPGYLEE